VDSAYTTSNSGGASGSTRENTGKRAPALHPAGRVSFPKPVGGEVNGPHCFLAAAAQPGASLSHTKHPNTLRHIRRLLGRGPVFRA
jgi:hypothetical protein